MADPDVREATADDVPAIRRIGERAWRAAYGDFLESATIDSAMEEWYDPDEIGGYIARSDVGYFVAEESEIVGFAGGGPSDEDDVAVLGAIYVHPDRWGEGIGSALLDRFEAFCRDRAYEAITLRVLAENGIGRSFYRTHGYERVDDRETDLFGQPVRDCAFRKRL